MEGDYVVPKDRYKMVLWTMILHGVGLLLPWNMFINAKSYFIDYKLHVNYTGDPTPYGQYFMSYLGFAARVPNLILSWINIFMNWKITYRTRIFWCIMVQIIVFSSNLFLSYWNSNKWPRLFLLITLFGVVLINMTIGIYQSSLFGFAGKLPPIYIGAIILGINGNGVFVSLLSLLSELIMPTHKTAGILYFTLAIVVLLACLNSIIFLSLNKFFRYHSEPKSEGRKHNRRKVRTKETIPYWHIFKKIQTQLLDIFLTSFVNLAIFPVLHAFIKPSSPEFIIPSKFFSGITCFFTYNLFAFTGSYLAPHILWPKTKHVWIPILLRVVFIPLFLFCNYQPPGIDRALPVFISNDYIYWLLSAANGFLSGYLTSLTMMYVPGCVDEIYSSTASMFASAILETGSLCGILFSFLEPTFLEYYLEKKTS